ncbi:uncharacterized protein UTRI_00590_B [Ustilago trichophora]|uniref:RING-type domain-containing protein n=1 Tax=Ustilago trichophora TaxID=86804 RepID=A0A5C3DPS6_9BASI|nr:uncharacterized protein UTRI_00590_B [Ustilago trichophora]
MPHSTSTSGSTELEPPLPRPTVVAGSRPSSRASSIARSAYSSVSASRSASPAQHPSRITRDRSVGSASGSTLGSARSRSSEAGPSSSSIRSQSRPLESSSSRTAANTRNVVEISSDSSDDDDDVVPVGPDPVHRPRSSDFEVSSIRRAAPAAPLLRSDLFSPPPPIGSPAEPLFFDRSQEGRTVGVSVDPSTGDFLTQPMPIVRPQSSTSHSDPDGSFTIISAQVAPQPRPPPPRSEHPITDQRLRSTNLAMPTRSPPRSKPPPIEHPLLSTYTCPICFDAPKNLSVTPCGHFFCGECLFQALKTQAVQRGAMEEEESLFSFNLFSPFAPAGTFGAGRGAGGTTGRENAGSDGGRGEAAFGAGRGRGGGARGSASAGGRGRNKPDPLAGQCPVCRAKIKGAFNGREKNGIAGLRLTIGKPIDDPRQENGQMKIDPKEHESGSVHSNDTDDDDEVTLPTSKPERADTSNEAGLLKAEEAAEQTLPDVSPKAARGKRRSSSKGSGSPLRRSPRTQAQVNKRQRQSSDSSATQTE